MAQIKKRNILPLVLMTFFLVTSFSQARAADTGSLEQDQAGEIEIEGPEEIQQPEIPLRPEQIQPKEEPLIPEIPKRIKRTGLSPAEKQRLDKLDREHMEGKITTTEYELEKDALVREANITF